MDVFALKARCRDSLSVVPGSVRGDRGEIGDREPANRLPHEKTDGVLRLRCKRRLCPIKKSRVSPHGRNTGLR